MTTMVLIGLWHGITWNFAIWGAWHGLGLFIHNRWTDLLRRRGVRLPPDGALPRVAGVAGALLTFHYVTLGWAWFALPSLSLSSAVLLGLIGIRP
jgi:alginate O-acetyltransferase complex protein AlgI